MAFLKLSKNSFLPHQYDFLMSKHPQTALVSGFGGGKTYAFLRKCLINHIFNRRDFDNKSYGNVLYPTLEMASEVFIPEFKNLLEEYMIDYRFSEKYLRFETSYGIVRIYTLNRPDRLVGTNNTWIGIDEFDTVPTDLAMKVYNKALGRLRGNSNPCLFLVTTPEGFKATYRIFVEQHDDSKKIIHAKSVDNKYLPKTYIDLMSGQYDERMVKAYIEGQFVNMSSGQVYYAFDREVHVFQDLKLDDSVDLSIMFDFNVYPMAVCWGQVNPFGGVNILGEYVSHDYTGVDRVCDALLDMLPLDVNLVVYGDASGRFGSANSKSTCYDIIYNKFVGRFKSLTFKVPNANPAVRDRINAVNILFTGNSAKVRIDSNCKRLIADFESVVWDDKGKGIGKGDINLTHISDAYGYMVSYEFPIFKPSSKAVTMSM